MILPSHTPPFAMLGFLTRPMSCPPSVPSMYHSASEYFIFTSKSLWGQPQIIKTVDYNQFQRISLFHWIWFEHFIEDFAASHFQKNFYAGNNFSSHWWIVCVVIFPIELLSWQQHFIPFTDRIWLLRRFTSDGSQFFQETEWTLFVDISSQHIEVSTQHSTINTTFSE